MATDIKKSKIKYKATSVSKYYATNAEVMRTHLHTFNHNARHIKMNDKCIKQDATAWTFIQADSNLLSRLNG
jgi:hypothetical protein